MHVLAGLVQSVLAAALSQAGKSVLHIDRYVLLKEVTNNFFFQKRINSPKSRAQTPFAKLISGSKIIPQITRMIRNDQDHKNVRMIKKYQNVRMIKHQSDRK